MEIIYTMTPCALGYVLVAATDRGLCSIQLGDQPLEMVEILKSRFPKADFKEDKNALTAWGTKVANLIENPQQDIALPLDIQGTAFQQQVWKALQQIPVGTTMSYGEVARHIGNPKAVRAVAGACAANKLALVIPCHRVVASNGQLGGYRWGIERKRVLIDREKAS